MRIIQTIRKQYWLSVGLLTAMSATFLLMPWASGLADRTGDWSIRIVGVLFWLFAITGYGSVIKANANRKRFLNKRFGRDIQTNFKPGVLCVFSNKLAEIADIMLAIFAIAFVVALFTRLKNTYYIIVILSLLVWAANMHCLFNGRIYRITKYEYKEKRKL